jgi:hypothetical protein
MNTNCRLTLLSAALLFAACGGPLEEEPGEAPEAALADEAESVSQAVTSTNVAPGPVYSIAKLGTDVYFTTVVSSSSSSCPSWMALRRYRASAGTTTTVASLCNAWSTDMVSDGTFVYLGVGVFAPGASQTAYSVRRFNPTNNVMSVLANISGEVNAVRVDETFLYYAGAGVGRLPKSGGAATTLLTGNYYALAIDATNAFVSNSWGIYRVPKAGGAYVTLSGSGASELALDGTDLYWLQGDNIRVGRLPKAGGASTTLYTQGSWNRIGAAMVVDGSNVYFVDSNDVGGGAVLRRIPKSGGSATVLMSTLSVVGAMIDAGSSGKGGALSFGGSLWVGDYSYLRKVEKNNLVFQQAAMTTN